MSIRIYGALPRGRMSGLLSGVLLLIALCLFWSSSLPILLTQFHDYAIGHFSIEFTMLTVLRYLRLGIKCQILYLAVMAVFSLISLTSKILYTTSPYYLRKALFIVVILHSVHRKYILTCLHPSSMWWINN
jgi:hypothetical protein